MTTDSGQKPAHINRRPLPSNILRVGQRRTVAAEKVADRPPPQAPDWLNDGAKAEWRRLAPCLAPEWQPRYADALAIYCTLLAAFQKDPATFTPPMLAQLRGLQGCLGLSPRAHRALMHDAGRSR